MRTQVKRGRTSNALPRGLSASINKVWPSKYESKYEPLKEIPKDCVKELLLAMDKDLDGKISFDELVNFVKEANIQSFTIDLLETMFKEITSKRSIIKQVDRVSPITFNELFFCCKFIINFNSSG